MSWTGIVSRALVALSLVAMALGAAVPVAAIASVGAPDPENSPVTIDDDPEQPNPGDTVGIGDGVCDL